MTNLPAPRPSHSLLGVRPVLAFPALLHDAGPRTRKRKRYVEFFTAQIRKPHTRKAYATAIGLFLEWVYTRVNLSLEAIETIHVAT